MENWNKIKESILFEYQGDWKQIVIDRYSQDQRPELVEFLEKTYGITPSESSDQIYSFKLDDIEIFLYLFTNHDWQFDFNPNQIRNFAELNKVIEFMRQLAVQFRASVLLTHEAINDYPLITVDEAETSFNYNFWNDFKEI